LRETVLANLANGLIFHTARIFKHPTFSSIITRRKMI